VRVTDKCSVTRIWLPFDEQRFKTAGGARDGECLQTIGDA
jgi:hypothetical protein